MYMINPRTGKENYQIKPRGLLHDPVLTIRDVRDRELKLYKKCGGTDYLSWIICDNSPFKSRCKVYTLSNPEQDFWEQMADPTDGYIGIRIKGRNYEEIKELEADVAEGLTEFRFGIHGQLRTISRRDPCKLYQRVFIPFKEMKSSCITFS